MGKTLIVYISVNGNTAKKLEPYMKGAVSVDAKLVHSEMEIKDWVYKK